MKRLIMTSLALCAAVASAMPEKKELAKSQPLVNELMSSVVEDYKAKKKTAKEVAETAEKFANEAEGEAAKFLLLKGAITYYSRAAEYDKAADMVEAIKAEVKDVPPEVLSEIISKATLRISAKNAPRLFAQYKAARAQVKAQKELKTLEAALKKRPGNLVVRREYAEALAVSGDWKKALQEFALLKDTAAAMAKAELDGKAKNAELAEFWWSYKTQSEEAEDALKARAAMYYKQAIDAEELSGLKKTLAEQRIAEVGTSVVAAAEKTSAFTGEKGDCAFKIKGKEATLDLGEKYGKLEFVKCPAGTVSMYYEGSCGKLSKVKISRDFWIMKTILSPQQISFAPTAGGKMITLNQVDQLCDLLNEQYKDVLPKGMVFRLPSVAEWDYAFSASTRDRDDPFYSLITGLKWEKLKLADGSFRKNKWGIEYPETTERVMDRFSRENYKKIGLDLNVKDKNFMHSILPKPDDLVDAFTWSEEEDAVGTLRGAAWGIWYNVRDFKSLWGGKCRLVIGPDLVSEWRAKNKKK